MKLFLVFLSFALLAFREQISIYDISFTNLNEEAVDMVSFQSKRIVVLAFDGAKPDTALLQHMDSLQNTNAALQVIAVPALDLDSLNSTLTAARIDSLRIYLNLGLLITPPAAVRKSAMTNQHPLFAWLTHVEQNTHFDYDTEAANQMFVVSEKGTLFGILKSGTTWEEIDEIITRPYYE